MSGQKKFFLRNSLNLIAVLLFFADFAAAQVIVLPNAHSHNDYLQKHPLTDALNNGFASIEADVFLIKGELRVAHVHPFFRKPKTLETLYLKPLYDSIGLHKGSVYSNSKQEIILLIDIKSNASETYESLKPLLEKYKSVVSNFKNGIITAGAVTIVLTGNKPYDDIKKETMRYAFIDEDLRNMNSEKSTTVFVMASSKYSNVLKWKGKGNIPAEEKQKLTALVNQAHLQGKKVRLWASPENTVVWEELLNCGVDLINTDKLEEFKKFLIQPHQ